jgi:hypothetical protein
MNVLLSSSSNIVEGAEGGDEEEGTVATLIYDVSSITSHAPN